MLDVLHILNLTLCSKQYNKIDLLDPILAPQLKSGWWHNYSTKTRPVGCANEQSMYSLMSMDRPQRGFDTLVSDNKAQIGMQYFSGVTREGFTQVAIL